jgi:hypothetical protein
MTESEERRGSLPSSVLYMWGPYPVTTRGGLCRAPALGNELRISGNGEQGSSNLNEKPKSTLSARVASRGEIQLPSVSEFISILTSPGQMATCVNVTSGKSYRQSRASRAVRPYQGGNII